ncbi:hypothetical protein JCM6882_003383 [Rhodosporidiobolus microsporus]
MVVKFGSEIRAEEEARIIKFVREKGIKEVPKMYGTSSCSKINCVFLEFIDAVTLDDVWSSLSSRDQATLISQFTSLLARVHALRPSTPSTPIGDYANLSSTPASDPASPASAKYTALSLFLSLPPTFSPPTTSLDFIPLIREWFVPRFAATWVTSGDERWRKSIAPFLDTTAPVVFTHGDMHGGNVLVRQGPPTKGYLWGERPGEWEVVSLIDWEAAGWYPSWVEGHLLRAAYVCSINGVVKEMADALRAPGEDTLVWSWPIYLRSSVLVDKGC